MRQDETLAAALIPEAGEMAPLYELIELLFFAYRDFVGDPDRMLETYGFGRAHHRVIHFVDRNPGLTIAALLDILKITKQSLNRVLKELITKGYIESRSGIEDRRQRHLHLVACDERHGGPAVGREPNRQRGRRNLPAWQRRIARGDMQCCATRDRRAFERPAVRGAAMNPVDHPHGGGEGKSKGGRHPVTPWGVPTLGKRTRAKHKESNKLIVRGRKRGKEKR